MLQSEGWYIPIVDEEGRLVDSNLREIAFWDPTGKPERSQVRVSQEELPKKRKIRVSKGEIKITSEGVLFNGKRTKFDENPGKVLRYLIGHSQETSSREVIAQEVGIAEKQVRHSVADLRKVLQDNRRCPQWIATVKGGYRLVATVVRE